MLVLVLEKKNVIAVAENQDTKEFEKENLT